MVTEKVGPLLDSLTATSDCVNELVTSFTSESGPFQQTLVSIETTMEKVNSGDGTVDMILNDDGFREDVAGTLSKVDETVEELRLASAEIKEMTGQFQSETVPKLNDAIVRVPETFEEVGGTAQEVADELKTKVADVPQAMSEFSGLMVTLQQFPLLRPFIPSDEYIVEGKKWEEVEEARQATGGSGVAKDVAVSKRQPQPWRKR